MPPSAAVAAALRVYAVASVGCNRNQASVPVDEPGDPFGCIRAASSANDAGAH
ncbi:phosphoribosyltransferase domain protein, partial [Yersinia pestis PY-89]